MPDTILETPVAPAAAPAASAPAAGTPTTVPAPAPAAAPAAAPTVQTGFLGENGTLNFQHAAGYLPKELHGKIDGLQARFEGKTVADVINSYTSLEGEYSQLKGARAVPEKATLDAYGIAKPEALSDDLWNADAPKIGKFVEIAHAAGIGKEEFGKLFGAYAETLVADHTAIATAAREAKQAAYNNLVDAWGAEFEPKRETAFNHVLAEFTQLGINPEGNPDAIALMNNPLFIRFAHAQAAKLGEGSTTLPPGAQPTTMSDGERALDIMNNPQNPMHEKFLQETKEGKGPTIDYVERLRSKVRPPRPAA